MVIKTAKRGTLGTLRAFGVALGSIVTTVALFILLPVINAIAEGGPPDTILNPVDSVELPQPDEVVEEEEPEPEEPEPEEPEPELEEAQEDFTLEQLDLMLSADVGGTGGLGGGVDFKLDLSKVTGGDGDGGLFDLADLDAKPTPINQPQPSLTKRERSATPGKAVVIFMIDSKGRVKNPKVRSTSNPLLGAAALRTVKKWRFKPGTYKGKPVATRSLQSITFPKQK